MAEAESKFHRKEEEWRRRDTRRQKEFFDRNLNRGQNKYDRPFRDIPDKDDIYNPRPVKKPGDIGYIPPTAEHED